VIPRRTSPKGTGFVRGLYRLDAHNEEASEAFERIFFGQVDNLAKLALDMLHKRVKTNWTTQVRSAWSRFLMGMLFRNPERIAATQKTLEEVALLHYETGEAEYNLDRGPDDPEFLESLVRQIAFNTVEWTADIMDSVRLGEFVTGMRWTVKDISDSGMTFFTSDRPIVMTNGLAGEEGHLVMPISPQRAFIACSSEAKEQQLHRGFSSLEFARATNRSILRYAQRFAWHTDDTYINRAKEHLAIESHVSELFFAGAPRRALEQQTLITQDG